MKILIFVCSLLTVTVAQNPELSCIYRIVDQIYQCELTINNPNGFDNFTEIGGTHLQGFTDADVTNVFRNSGTSTNIPQIICDTFLNLIEVNMRLAFLTEIGDNAFNGCSHIRQLHLHYNRIASISENAFANLREVENIDLSNNVLPRLPENVFANQQNLTALSLSFNSIYNLPNGVFRPLQNLETLNFGFNNLDAVNNEWFSTNSNLNSLSLEGNRINLTEGTFVGFPQSLQFLNLGYNGISEIPVGAFAGVLDQLTRLDIDNNPIERIDDGVFQGLYSLTSLSLAVCRIRDLNLNSFEGLGNLTFLELGSNEIEDIPAGTLAPMPNLNFISLWNNRIKTLRRNSFGSLAEFRTVDLGENIVNALDRVIIDEAVNLDALFFGGNLCADNIFVNFLVNRPTYLTMLEVCFRNMRYIVDTTTESDGVYHFFDGPHPGILIRVQSDNEVQIALTPFNFMWVPSIEIFIGSANNTRSVIRMNEEIDVVTVPTPNVIQPNQWNDFRVTWANQNVQVFSGSETFPFMSYTMQHFFPVNFYGLRAVETRAMWSVSPYNN